MFTVALQCRRSRSEEPEDNVFVMRWWADLQFFIVALRRLRRAAGLAGQVGSIKDSVASVLRAFDEALPHPTAMPNVGEHLEDYALDKGRDKTVDRRSLRIVTWDGETYCWLGKSLNIDVAHAAAHELSSAISSAPKTIS